MAGSTDPKGLDDATRAALLRWRLALGPDAEKTAPELRLSGLGATGSGLDEGRVRDLDKALTFVYDERSGGLGQSRPYVPEWLAAVREFFSQDTVALVQRDAIEQKGLTQLLFEPETLPLLEKNVELVATLLSAKGLIPENAKEAARAIVREVVDDIRRRLESEIRNAVFGAVRRDRRSVMPVLRNLDAKRTITKNLRGWDRDKKRLVPEQLYFFANQRKRHEIDVAVLVDQSGSMGESVVYSSIMAAIFASIDVLNTKLLFFDTEIVDVTPLLDDPVEVIFTAQLGGGTDINRAIAYAEQNFIERPDKTILVLVSDLFEGGNRTEMIARLARLKEARVKVVCLLALTDRGTPSYDHTVTSELTALGIPCFGCTPKRLPEMVERVMKGQDLAPLMEKEAVR